MINLFTIEYNLVRWSYPKPPEPNSTMLLGKQLAVWLDFSRFVPTVAFSQLSSNICCPRDCVSRTAHVGTCCENATVGTNGLIPSLRMFKHGLDCDQDGQSPSSLSHESKSPVY